MSTAKTDTLTARIDPALNASRAHRHRAGAPQSLEHARGDDLCVLPAARSGDPGRDAGHQATPH